MLLLGAGAALGFFAGKNGAGSIVTRDVPPKVVAAGNPCRVLRAITEEDRRCCFRRLPFPPEDLKPFGKEEEHDG